MECGTIKEQGIKQAYNLKEVLPSFQYVGGICQIVIRTWWRHVKQNV